MNETAWKIINGLCSGIGWAFFIILFADAIKSRKDLALVGGMAIGGVLLALLIGKFLFGK